VVTRSAPVSLLEARSRWDGCQRCRLSVERRRIVFGGGPDTARVMVVGDSPSIQDEREDKPFCGDAGLFLWREAAQVGLDLSTCYLTHIVACHTPEARTLLADEAEACRSRLESIAHFVRPEIILGLGGTALTALTGEVGITKWRGRMIAAVGLTGGLQSIPVLPTFHPAGLIPGRSRTQGDLDAFRGDLQSVVAWLNVNQSTV
jgi:uracil-DNA glycosylase